MSWKAQPAGYGLEKLRALGFACVDTRPQEDRAASVALEKEVRKPDSASRAEQERFGVRLAGMGCFDLLEGQYVAQGGKLGVAAAELRVTLYNHKHLPLDRNAARMAFRWNNPFSRYMDEF
jgi:hypothetical protein